jgi:hypothetical protein
MAFNFSRKRTKKYQKSSWHENALLLAVAGSIIAVMGQLAGTIIPIVYGPQDISDFSIDLNGDIDQFYDVADLIPGKESIYVNITVNIHPFLRPYESKIYFKAIGPMKNTTALFDPPEIKLQRRLSFLEFVFPLQSIKSKHNYSNSDGTQFDQVELKPYESRLNINIKNATSGKYPITIQGIGNNGKIRNTTLYLWILSDQNYQRYLEGDFDILGNEINI